MTHKTLGAGSPVSVIREGGGRVAPSLRELVVGTAAVFDVLRSDVELPPAKSVDFVLTDDMRESLRLRAGSFIGVENLESFTPERIGGQVVGKTLFQDEAHSEIVILMNDAVFEADEGLDRAIQIYLIAHEMAHGLMGQLRSAAGPPMAPAFLPWEVSPWLARYALDEYWADSLAEMVLRQSGQVTTDAGEVHPLSARLILANRSFFIDSCVRHLTWMADRIHQYRLDGMLDDMWLDIQHSSSQLLITLAHAQAEGDDPAGEFGPVVTAEHESVLGPLHDCWERLLPQFASVPLLITPGRFRELERAVLRDTGETILDLWRALGLTFRPEGESFYITVASPEESWSPPRRVEVAE